MAIFYSFLSDIAVGAAGAATITIAQFARIKIKNWKIARKYPVEGNFIAKFEDTVDGQRITTNSFAELKQKGEVIHGTNYMPDGRTWSLEGKIVGAGHLSGTYTAESMYDEGVGAFYVRVGHNTEDLEGFWSGYDHVNKIVNSGRYIFRKIPKIDVVKASQSDRAAVLDIAADTFGSGYIDDIERFLNNENPFLYVAKNSNKTIGFVTGEILESGDLYAFVPENESELTPDLIASDRNGTLGIIRTAAVSPSFHARGVGTSLIKYAEQALRRLGAETIIIGAWQYDSHLPISGIMRENDYDRVCEIEGYWAHACESGQFRCPKKQNSCVCSSVIFRKPLT